MNKMIEVMQNRRSVRSFTGEEIPEKDIYTILQTAQRAASSINGQQVSIMVVRDKEKIAKISELCYQKHIATADTFFMILIDYFRGNYATDSINSINLSTKSVNGLLVGAVDDGIVLNALQNAADALGYGTTAIGAVRAHPDKFIEMFDLPEGVFPLVGSTLGVPAANPHKTKKPRVPFDSFAFFDKYDKEKVKEGVDIHEAEMIKWRTDEGTEFLPTYKELIAKECSQDRDTNVNKALKQQGFDLSTFCKSED